MSNPDSFIDEVSEEVRRERLFRLMRRYGWIPLTAVVLIVGGAAAWEWRESQAEAAAQARGDAILAALSTSAPEARAAALAEIAGEGEADLVTRLALAAEQQAAGETQAAIGTLDAIAGDGEVPELYRDLAALKALMIDSDRAPEEKLMALEALSAPGAAYAPLAREQIALVHLSQGDTEAALEQLRALLEAAETTAGLRDRAASLMVALGETPEAAVAPDAAAIAGQ
ncbi:hypothetical protein [Limimaricola pyoseonensis]|uniref:Tetratricopeptide repeat-like domain-containing protein n=1 Tax=Limimaricola pyoseonensis TaxID=521013 RepID=A0A1G6ZRL2_9RHOB|nr:hypothetical protein [Limimaricola pyoseonensis]SDE05189.1 hypothetical protein SAMN04488567_0644 [Limimaricola pyoseonensis]